MLANSSELKRLFACTFLYTFRDYSMSSFYPFSSSLNTRFDLNELGSTLPSNNTSNISPLVFIIYNIMCRFFLIFLAKRVSPHIFLYNLLDTFCHPLYGLITLQFLQMLCSTIIFPWSFYLFPILLSPCSLLFEFLGNIAFCSNFFLTTFNL